MDIFGVFSMLGGIALFLFGMSAMGDALAKLSGGKLERILEKFTNKPIKGVLLGALVTAVIQSSSATTVMVVGFVNSGIMKLTQAVSIIMGANVGTTITSWILSLAGLEGESILIKLLKPSSFAPVFAFIGIVLYMFAKKSPKKRDIGEILLGFAILMTGMETMSAAVEPLAGNESFTNILTMFSNPLLGMLAGAVLTAVIQSSSASVGILQALCISGVITFDTAIPIIMGQNIGTCVTALISGVGASKNAKRAALVHLYFNLLGTVVVMVVFYTLNAFMHFDFMGNYANADNIAFIHSAFNIVATIMLLPFSKGLEKLACMTIRDSKDKPETGTSNKDFLVLDERFLQKPAFAVEQCRNVTARMAENAMEAVVKATGLFDKYDENIANEIIEIEDKVDRYEDEIGSYLVKLSSRDLSQKDSQTLSVILHCIGDFERISDHAVNILDNAKEVHEKHLAFSEKAMHEVNVFTSAVLDVLSTAVEVFEKEDIELARTVEPLEEVVDQLNAEMKKRHVRRLREGKCTIEMGFVLSDITTNYERVADHCSNIALCLLQVQENGFDTHEYINKLDKGENTFFRNKFLEYMEKYSI